jgi:hypothetical protein
MAQALPPGEAIPPRDLLPSPRVKTPQRRIPLPPRPIRWLLRGWWALAALLFTTILGIVLGVLLAKTPNHWPASFGLPLRWTSLRRNTHADATTA